MQEKRRHKRIHFDRQVQIDFFTEVFDQCQVKNISLSGMFVTGKFAHDVEDQCYVKVFLPRHPGCRSQPDSAHPAACDFSEGQRRRGSWPQERSRPPLHGAIRQFPDWREGSGS